MAAVFEYFKYALFQESSSTERRSQEKISQDVYNFVISLYATFKPNLLLDYLKKFGKNSNKIPYDIEYVLRVCIDKSEYLFLLI